MRTTLVLLSLACMLLATNSAYVAELQRPGVRPKVGAPALFAGDRQVQVRRDVQDDHEDEIKEMLMELKKLTYK